MSHGGMSRNGEDTNAAGWAEYCREGITPSLANNCQSGRQTRDAIAANKSQINRMQNGEIRLQE